MLVVVVVVCGFDAVEDDGANSWVVDSGGGDDEDEGECGGDGEGDGGDACAAAAVGWLATITCDVGFTIDAKARKRRTVLSQKPLRLALVFKNE